MTAARDEQAKVVPLDRLKPDPMQPRKSFDEASLTELAESIKQYGVLQPLLVLEQGNEYQIVTGERRYHASKLAGLKDVPVRLFTSHERAREAQLIENLQRENLSLFDEAHALAELKEGLGASLRTLEQALGKSRAYIDRRLRLLDFPDDIQDMVRQEPGLFTKAFELAKIEDAGRRQRHIQALLSNDAEAVVLRAPKGGRPANAFRFSQKKNGGFELVVKYKPGQADRDELIKQLEEALLSLKNEKTV